ncbi:MAG: hypothetical protein KDE24_09390, partial [Caldilinea sp.]|nr:hypothetical protein [Caldilinea sp.]
VVLAGASGPTVVDDAAAAFERMDAALQNSKEALGQLFAPAVAAIAENIAAAATTAAEAMQRANAQVPADMSGANAPGLLGGNRAAVYGPVADQGVIDAQAELQRLHRLALDAQDAMALLVAQNQALQASGDYTAVLQIEQNNQQLAGLS